MRKSVIGLAKTFAPAFEKLPDRLSKPAALNTLVFFKIVDGAFGHNSKIKRITLNNAFVILNNINLGFSQFFSNGFLQL